MPVTLGSPPIAAHSLAAHPRQPGHCLGAARSALLNPSPPPWMQAGSAFKPACLRLPPRAVPWPPPPALPAGPRASRSSSVATASCRCGTPLCAGCICWGAVSGPAGAGSAARVGAQVGGGCPRRPPPPAPPSPILHRPSMPSAVLCAHDHDVLHVQDVHGQRQQGGPGAGRARRQGRRPGAAQRGIHLRWPACTPRSPPPCACASPVPTSPPPPARSS